MGNAFSILLIASLVGGVIGCKAEPSSEHPTDTQARNPMLNSTPPTSSTPTKESYIGEWHKLNGSGVLTITDNGANLLVDDEFGQKVTGTIDSAGQLKTSMFDLAIVQATGHLVGGNGEYERFDSQLKAKVNLEAAALRQSVIDEARSAGTHEEATASKSLPPPDAPAEGRATDINAFFPAFKAALATKNAQSVAKFAKFPLEFGPGTITEAHFLTGQMPITDEEIGAVSGMQAPTKLQNGSYQIDTDKFHMGFGKDANGYWKWTSLYYYD